MMIFRSSAVLLILLWAVCLNQPAYAQKDLQESPGNQEKFEILYYEVLPPMALASRSDESGQHDALSSEWTWSFESFGKSFDLILQSNDRLIAKLPLRQRKKMADSHQLYRGKIDGIENSWVRLTRTGEKWFGMIWDGQEIYIIDPMSVLEPALQGFSLTPHSAHGIYRLSDTRELEAQVCGLGSAGIHANSIHDYEALVQELQERVTSNAEGAVLNLDMAVVADVEFSTIQQSLGTSTDDAVIARINVVDGIFSEQVGVQINLVDIQELSNNGSLTSTDPFILLQQFGEFTSSGTFNNPGVAHLFTGRDLIGGTIGIAYVSSLCSSRFGIGVNEITGGGTLRALVVAHELGHNFGAPHDNESGSACASTPGTFLMNPFINGSDQFSQCSITEMQPEINSASCISVINLAQSDLQVNPPISPNESVVGSSFGMTIAVRNNGPNTANNADTVITIPSQISLQNVSIDSGTCTSPGAGQVNCDLGNVPNGVTRTMTLTLQGQTPGQFSIQAVASASNDQNGSNNSNEKTVNIIISPPPPPPPPPGGTVSINFQPANAAVPAGYLKDDGSIYSTSRGYGWSQVVDNRERQAQADQRLDTLVFIGGNSVVTWRYDLSNGEYRVSLSSGDPSYAQGPHQVAVEGTTVVNQVTTQRNEFVTVTDHLVNITDGDLMIQLTGTTGHTMLNYVTLTPVGAPPPPPPPPPRRRRRPRRRPPRPRRRPRHHQGGRCPSISSRLMPQCPPGISRTMGLFIQRVAGMAGVRLWIIESARLKRTNAWIRLSLLAGTPW